MTNYPTHFKLKSRKIPFLKNINFNCQIVLKILTEHGSDTVTRHAKFRNNLTTEQQVIVKQDFARFNLRVHFGRMYYIAEKGTDNTMKMS